MRIEVNSLTDGEVEAKFRGLALGARGREGCDRALAEDGLFESPIVA